MKRFIVILAALAVAVAFAAPAMADLKLTTKGYMDVTGIMLKKDIRDTSPTVQREGSNAWYQMEMVIDPTLHINDKVRIVARVTIMERYMNGYEATTNSPNANPFVGPHPDYRAEAQGGNDFWWEWLYMEFPLGPGTLAIGRMSGGGWGYDFQDAADNRDRIKYTTKLGHVTLVGLIEKLTEGDGGAWLGGNIPNNSWTNNSYSDTDGYAIGAVIPFSKAFIWRPLLYYILFEDVTAAGLTALPEVKGHDWLFVNAFTLNLSAFKLDAEISYRTRNWDNGLGTGVEFEASQLGAWLEATFNLGPAQIGAGIIYIQGEDSADTSSGNERESIWGVGKEFQPLLLLFSEDVGLLFDSRGVPNNSVGSSGFNAAYIKAGFKLSDTMKVRAVFGYVNADEMLMNTATGLTPDDHIGMEIDLGFEWQLLPNLKYVFEAGYLMAGDYWNDTDGFANDDLSNDPYGFRHMMVITW